MLMCYILPVSANSPGGVEGVRMWSEVVPKNFNLMGEYFWKDYSGDSIVSYIQKDSVAIPFYSSKIRYINFRPAMQMPGNDQTVWAELKKANLSQFTVLGVWGSLNNSEIQNLADIKIDTQKNVSITSRNSQANNPYVQTSYYSSSPIFTSWGLTVPSVFSFKPDSNNYCAELIVYSRILSPFERSRAESFLAMKYGITLQHSYFVGDTLLWDISNPYVKNIAAIGFDSAKKFCQRQSVSSKLDRSIESAFYQDNNSYNRLSDNLLMTIGYEKDCLIPDGQYIMCGENDKTVNETKHAVLPIKLHKSKWQSRSTTCVADQSADLSFSNDSIGLIKLHGNTYGLVQKMPDKKCRLHFNESSANSYLSFRQRYPSATFEVVFASTDNSRFGFRFNADNTISKIAGQSVEKLEPSFSHQKKLIEISRDDYCVRLTINSIGDSTLCVPVQSKEMAMDVVFEPDASRDYATELNDVRIDQLCYTGQSIILNKAILNPSFSANNNTAIIVNPNDDSFSDNGNILSGRIYYASPTESDDKKLVFDDVYLNSDNLTEYFTVARIDSVCAESYVVEDSVSVSVLHGTPPYRLSLIKKEQDGSLSTQKEIISYDNSFSIGTNGISADSIFVTEVGLQVFACGDIKHHRTLKSEIVGNKSSMTFRKPGLQQKPHCRVGFTRGDSVEYGFGIENNQLYIIKNGTIQFCDYTADVLCVRKTGSSIEWLCDGIVVNTQTADSGNYGLIEAIDGNISLDGVVFDGFTDAFNATPGVFHYNSRRRMYKSSVELTALPPSPIPHNNNGKPAYKQNNNAPDGMMAYASDGNLSVERESGNSFNFTATLSNVMPQCASFLVFNSSGKMVYRQELKANEILLPIDFSVSSPGVYIAKVITENGEYSRKFIAN